MTAYTTDIIRFKVKMKPSRSKRDVLVDHPERVLRCVTVSFYLLCSGSVVQAEDIESIEILGPEKELTGKDIP